MQNKEYNKKTSNLYNIALYEKTQRDTQHEEGYDVIYIQLIREYPNFVYDNR